MQTCSHSRGAAFAAITSIVVLAACSRSYHAEYHPETRYSFVQNISIGPPTEPERCKLGRVPECWRACMHRGIGEACYMMAVMFETGHGLARSHEDATRFVTLAGKLGYAPASIDVDMAAPYLDLWDHDAPRAPPPGARVGKGSVSSPGGVVVYGSLNGDVYVGQ